MANERHVAGRAHVVCTGCPENRIDGARMQETLRASGYEIASSHDQADLVVYVSCALTHRTQEHSVEMVRLLRREMRPDAWLIVCGCLPKINPARLREVYDGPTFGSDEVDCLASLVGARGDGGRANYLLPRAGMLGPLARLRTSYEACGPYLVVTALLDRLYTRRLNAATTEFRGDAYCIKVSTGCDHHCTYCAVRISRGAVRSKPIQEVAKEFDEGLLLGHREFALIGTDLGSYGHDRGQTLTDLLDRLLQRKGDYELRLRNVHPQYIIRENAALCDMVRTGHITHIATALQSGSDAVLRRMGRGHRAGEFAEAVAALHEANPRLELRTQVIVGFPGETDAEFEETVRWIDRSPFEYTEVYLFEARPGTAAEALTNPVPRAVAARRRNRLYTHALWRAIRNRAGSRLSPKEARRGAGAPRREEVPAIERAAQGE